MIDHVLSGYIIMVISSSFTTGDQQVDIKYLGICECTERKRERRGRITKDRERERESK